MARKIRMPSEQVLLPGSVRNFARELFDRYKDAHRPPLRHISQMIERHDNLPGTASPETIRRMLNGTTVPANWSTVYAVLVVLCELAGVTPDQKIHFADDPEHHQSTLKRELEYRWHRALDFPDERELPSDDPPF